MNDILKSVIDDNIEQRYKILLDLEGLKAYRIVRDYGAIKIDDNYNLSFVVNSSNQMTELEVFARASGIRSKIKAYNKDCLILNEFLHGLQGQDQIEALEYMARCCETNYKQFKNSYINYLKGQKVLRDDYNGELPLMTLEKDKREYSAMARTLKDTLDIALKHFQKALIKEQEQLKINK